MRRSTHLVDAEDGDWQATGMSRARSNDDRSSLMNIGDRCGTVYPCGRDAFPGRQFSSLNKAGFPSGPLGAGFQNRIVP